VFGYKIRSQTLDDDNKEGKTSKSNKNKTTEGKAPRSPSTASNEAGPVITVLEENAKLKQEILQLKKRLQDEGASKQ